MNDECPKTEHVDGKSHAWILDGDDPYVVCYWCGERRDAISGREIKATPTTTASESWEAKLFPRLVSVYDAKDR